jgi:hypothetical protein
MAMSDEPETSAITAKPANELVPYFIQNLINLVQFSQFAASVPGQPKKHGWQDEDIGYKQRPFRRVGV